MVVSILIMHYIHMTCIYGHTVTVGLTVIERPRCRLSSISNGHDDDRGKAGQHGEVNYKAS